MVSEKDGQEVKTPQVEKEPSQGDPGTEKKEEVTEVNKQKSEEKKQQGGYFPLGGSPGVSSVKTGSSSVEEEKTKNLPNSLEKANQVSPEKKEEIMDKDTEEKLSEVVKTITDGSEKTIDTLKTIGEQFTETLKARQANPAPVAGATQEKQPSKEASPAGLTPEQAKIIYREERKKEQNEVQKERRDQENRAKVEGYERRLSDMENWKKKCEAEGDPVACQRVEALEKEIKQKRPEAEKAKSELPEGVKVLEPMDEEKRKTFTEEQNLARDVLVAANAKALNETSNDRYRQMDKTDKDKIVDKPDMRERFLKTVTPKEHLQIVKVNCKKDVCQVELREGGYAIVQEGKDGKFRPLDKEVAKKMERLF